LVDRAKVATSIIYFSGSSAIISIFSETYGVKVTKFFPVSKTGKLLAVSDNLNIICTVGFKIFPHKFMTPENQHTTPEEAMELLGIEKSQYYARLKKLRMKAKRNGKTLYLDEEQMKLLREYNQTESAIALIDDSSELTLENIPQVEEPAGDERDDIMRQAAELRAQQLAMPDLIKLYLAAGMNESDLPADLREILAATRTAANPNVKKSAATIAQSMLQEYRSHQK